MPASKLELLVKMLRKQIKEYGKTNQMAAKRFQEMLEETIKQYHERRKHLTAEEAGAAQEQTSEEIIRNATEQYVANNELKIQPDGEIISLSRSPNMQAAKIIAEGKKHLGKRYVHGTAGPNTFDCSGFTSYIFGKFGYNLSRSSQVQYTQGTPVDRHSLRPGDLVFFKGRTSSGVGHVGMVVNVDPGRNSFQFIHASSSRGIMITDFSTSAYYIRRYVGAKRVIK
jgi:cell wall-associated NlpC family hydrolase